MGSRRASWIAIAGLVLMLSGCATARSAQQTVSGWFGAGRGAEKPQALYSAAAGVALHREPDASSEVVGKLGLYEGVLRYQIEGGYAYVESQKSGRSGWVRERDLIERIPVAKKPAAEPPAGTAEEPAAQDEPPAPEEGPAQPPEKSIFDPY